jgi:hypothetical protein
MKSIHYKMRRGWIARVGAGGLKSEGERGGLTKKDSSS